MALHTSGINGRLTGKNGGSVFSVARTRYGKMTTSREYVIPANPDTVLQQQVRELFRRASLHGGLVGSVNYAADWNNTLGELPGWNSIVGWSRDAMEYSGGIYQWSDPVPAKSLGPVYMPLVTGTHVGAAGSIDLTWPTTIVGDHCAAGDLLCGWVSYVLNPGVGGGTNLVVLDRTDVRSDATINVPGLTSGEEYQWVLWFNHDEGDGTYTNSPIAKGIEQAA